MLVGPIINDIIKLLCGDKISFVYIYNAFLNFMIQVLQLKTTNANVQINSLTISKTNENGLISVISIFLNI